MGDLERREDVHHLVVGFYRRIVFDDLLGPVFQEAAEIDWASHIPRLIDYWCRILHGDPSYRGALLEAHREVNDVEPFRPEHFDRWYELWETSIDEAWVGPLAQTAKTHAAATAGLLSRRLTDQDWSVPSDRPGPP